MGLPRTQDPAEELRYRRCRLGVTGNVLAGRGSSYTERELLMLQAFADGHSNAEIGRDLVISADMIAAHSRRLIRKLGARDRAHAVAIAFRSGLCV
jgi:DNA-binding NarL/FixJ family response regulator